MSDTSQQQVARGVRRRLVQIAVTLLLLGVATFLPAGTVQWTWGWVYVGLYVLGTLVTGVFVLRTGWEIVARRSETAGMKDWDQIVGGLFGVAYFVLTPAAAGFDFRLGWTGSVSIVVHLSGVVAFALGFALFSWAMLANAYFSTVVRVEEETGQIVCTEGPYRIVRHPGYLGAIAMSLSMPLLLGSAVALAPAVAAAVLLIARTVLEDRMLHEELHGYEDYAKRVPYRLLPGVW